MTRIGFVTMTALVLVPAVTAGGTLDRTFSERFDAPPGTVLRLEHGDGDVQITAWDQPAIEVHVVYRGETKSVGFGKDADFTVIFRKEGNTVRVVGKETSGSSFGFRYERIDEYRYTIQAPSHVALDLVGDDGSVTVEGWRADVGVKLDDGDIRLTDLTGNVSLALEDGDATLGGLKGALRLSADDGDVQASECIWDLATFTLEDGDVILKDCAGDISVKLDDGDVRFIRVDVGQGRIQGEDGNIDLALRGDRALDLEVESADGSVQLELEPGRSARFEVESEGGHIHLDLGDVSDLDRGTMRVSGKVGAGTGHLRIRTEDGDITVRDVPPGN